MQPIASCLLNLTQSLAPYSLSLFPIVIDRSPSSLAHRDTHNPFHSPTSTHPTLFTHHHGLTHCFILTHRPHCRGAAYLITHPHPQASPQDEIYGY
uniref:Uncharacterized protein n=1 Tax=Lotus japonicus TaxID=34305 RepID=I3SCA6_LOTJA|nr:unknown [Lotus japonicus]